MFNGTSTALVLTYLKNYQIMSHVYYVIKKKQNYNIQICIQMHFTFKKLKGLQSFFIYVFGDFIPINLSS